MNFIDEYGTKYNANVDGAIKRLKESRVHLELDKESFTNKELIRIGSSIKILLSDIKNARLHSMEAYRFIQRSLTVVEIEERGLRDILTALYKVEEIFSLYNENISSENFFWLLDSTKAKSRRVVFDETQYQGVASAGRIIMLLDTYETTLMSLYEIQNNIEWYFKKMIGFKDTFNENFVDIALYEDSKIEGKKGKFKGISILEFDHKSLFFVGRTYTIQTHTDNSLYSFYAEDCNFSLDVGKKYPDLMKWIEVYLPEYLI